MKQEGAKKGPIGPFAPDILFIPNFQILGRQGSGIDVDDRMPFHLALENFAGQFENRGQPHLCGDPVELFVAEVLGEPGPDVGAPRHKGAGLCPLRCRLPAIASLLTHEAGLRR